MSMLHLKELLVAKGKTQTELAEVLGRDKSAITNLLKGNRQLKAAEVTKIATFLGVTPTVVLGQALHNGMAEPVRIPFQGTPSATILRSGQLIEDAGRWYFDDGKIATEHQYMLEAKDYALDLQGIIPGDLVVCSPTPTPQSGDVLVVQHYLENGTANTILRLYQPPFLVAHSTREGFDKLHEERGNVAIVASVSRLIRLY